MLAAARAGVEHGVVRGPPHAGDGQRGAVVGMLHIHPVFQPRLQPLPHGGMAAVGIPFAIGRVEPDERHPSLSAFPRGILPLVRPRRTRRACSGAWG